MVATWRLPQPVPRNSVSWFTCEKQVSLCYIIIYNVSFNYYMFFLSRWCWWSNKASLFAIVDLLKTFQQIFSMKIWYGNDLCEIHPSTPVATNLITSQMPPSVYWVYRELARLAITHTHTHTSLTNRVLLPRDELKRHYTLGEYSLGVEMEDVSSFDEELSDCLYKSPTENLNLVRGKQDTSIHICKRMNTSVEKKSSCKSTDTTSSLK